jgi:catechol 2,3-dioxygenase-like lactoylglutathione lyase family enzyme
MSAATRLGPSRPPPSLVLGFDDHRRPPLADELAQRLDDRELRVAFRAVGRKAVDAVHHAAVMAGVDVLHAPREWPEYHPGYYAVFVRDPDGHNVEAVHHD